ncbi:30S ribosomal protein S6 [Candidatus Azambacteria bacterium]|nr:30S ribosomal protein S6 [Candidatus Azambacteria bacterium]MBI3685397.1 30S ribosomal protein S6 [Candidatus Azambacteria bacterium]
MDTEAGNKKLYELSYFITPDLKDEEVALHAQSVKNLIVSHAGDVSKEEAPHKRRLAYPIRHKTQGYFGYLHFHASPVKISEIKNTLSLDKSILRHLLVTVDAKQITQMQKPYQSAALQEKLKRTAIDKEKIKQTIFKEGAPQLEEKKLELEELDKKLEEILNK